MKLHIYPLKIKSKRILKIKTKLIKWFAIVALTSVSTNISVVVVGNEAEAEVERLCQEEKEACIDRADEAHETVKAFIEWVQDLKEDTCNDHYDSCRDFWPDWMEWIPGCERSKTKCLNAAAAWAADALTAASAQHSMQTAKRGHCERAYDSCKKGLEYDPEAEE